MQLVGTRGPKLRVINRKSLKKGFCIFQINPDGIPLPSLLFVVKSHKRFTRCKVSGVPNDNYTYPFRWRLKRYNRRHHSKRNEEEVECDYHGTHKSVLTKINPIDIFLCYFFLAARRFAVDERDIHTAFAGAYAAYAFHGFFGHLIPRFTVSYPRSSFRRQACCFRCALNSLRTYFTGKSEWE